MKPQTPLPWLASFEAASRHLNFTRAAEELGVTQGAISTHIQRLEADLGCALFERNVKGVMLTESGEAYRPHVRRALESLRTATEILFEKNKGPRISISCYSPSFADLWLAPLVPDLYRAFPSIEISISIDYRVTPYQEGRGDLTFVYEDPSVGGERFLPLMQERMIAVASPEIAAQSETTWPDVSFITVLGPRPPWSNWFHAAGLTPPASMREIQVNSMLSAVSLAKAGVGIALLARPLIDGHLNSGQLKPLAPRVELPALSHGIVVGDAAPKPPVVQRMVHWLRRRADAPALTLNRQ